MKEILQASYIYCALVAICRWFDAQWQESRLVRRFLSPGDGLAVSESSVLTKLWRWVHRLVELVFCKLRLDRVFDGSLFGRAFLWCVLAACVAPIVPTMALIGVTCVAFFALFVQFGCDGERSLVYSPVNKYVFLYAFVYLLATFTSVNISGSLLGGFLTVFFTLFAVALQNAVRSKRALYFIMVLLAAAGVVVSMIGIGQYALGLAGETSWLDEEMFSDISMRVYSTLQNPNVLAEYLLLITPLTFALVLTGKNWKEKILFFGAFCAMALCMVLTFSRGGYLGLLFAAAVFAVLIDRRFILLGLVGLVALYFVLPEAVIGRFMSIGDLGDSSTSYRVSIWMGTISMLRDYWLSGVGPGMAAFNMVYPSYGYSGIVAPHAHNLFLQITCDAGVCGLIIFVVIVFVFFRTVCAAISREKDRESSLYQKAIIASMVGFMVQSMTDYSFYNYRVMFMFWVFLGLGMVIARRTQLPERAE